MRWFSALVVAAILLVSCGSDPPVSSDSMSPDNTAPPTTQGPSKDVQTYDLPDGRSVVCVITSSYYGRGISCDWNGAA